MKVTVASQLPQNSAGLILSLFDDKKIATDLLSEQDAKTIELLIAKETITGKAKTVISIPTPASSYDNIIVVGLGEKDKVDANAVRQAFGEAAKTIKSQNLESLTIANTALVESAVEALILGLYEHNTYRVDSMPKDTKAVNSITVISTDADTEAKCLQAQTFAEGANFARDLSNAPGNYLTPTILADKAVTMAKANGCETEVLDEAAMTELKMGALLSVSKGSEEEARLISLKYTHPNAKKTLVVVGKGLTFDAGGISLKPSGGMEEMKYDMGGSAAAIGAFKIISSLKPEINVVCVVPSSENLPDGKASKPGDIVTAYNGKTIEVFNTDAEGRLILCDALAYAVDTYKPDKMVNLATLTGACIVAFGHSVSAVVGNNDAVIEGLKTAGEETYERLWQLPLYQDYIDVLKGKEADLCNSVAGGAGTITAGAFLSQFVGETPWAHLDIAGTAWNMKGASYIAKASGSGFGARLIAQWILNEA